MADGDEDLLKVRQEIDSSPFIGSLPEAAKGQLSELVFLLLDANKRTNLTAVRERDAVVRQHLADSCSLLSALPTLENITFCDLGTGAGFPLLPICIGRSTWKGTGIESIGKKTAFIEDAARKLGLANVETCTMRGEDAARTSLRESFDLGVSRAVGPIASLVEILLPLVKVGGRVVLYKTMHCKDELQASNEMIVSLGGEVETEYVYSVDESPPQRVLMFIRKNSPTNEQFPRRAGVPFKKPLA